MAYECVIDGGAILTQDFGCTDVSFEPRCACDPNAPGVCGCPYFHSGLDLASHCGAPVRSQCDGTVVAIGDDPGYGPFAVFIQAADVVLLYGHLQAATVDVGQSVSRGQLIGYEGTLGNSTGCHVHFSVRPAGDRKTECGALDPWPFVCGCPANPPPSPPPPPPIIVPSPPAPGPAAAWPAVALLLAAAGALTVAHLEHRQPGTTARLWRRLEAEVAHAGYAVSHSAHQVAGAVAR